ncbi:hypothetical protein [Halovulum sp. GXIMD14793]
MGRFTTGLFSVWLAGFIALTGAILWMTGGRLIFPLDDPYIHLATAENILRGTYGINLGEPSSASSSVLFPFLVALTQAIGLGEIGPILITAPAAGISVIALGQLLETVVPDNAWRWVIAILALFVISAFALPMTGIEHSLHVMLSMLAMLGLIRMTQGSAPGMGLTLIVILLPLIRFEGIGLAGMIILVEVFLGHRRAALLQVAGIVAALVIYGLTMHAMGLPILPSSVMVKVAMPDAVAASAGSGLADRIIQGLDSTLRSMQGTMLLILASILPLAWSAFGRRRSDLPVMATAVACLLGHAVAGHIGAFARYEVYALAIGLIGLLWLCRSVLGRPLIAMVLAVGLVFVAKPYAKATWKTPPGSQNIFDQHVQMHELAARLYDGDVAVHDIGWVAYHNDNTVLDLWGLASEEVRRMRADTYVLTPAQLSDLITRHDIGLVMVYEDVFRTVPDDWTRVARMTSSAVTAGRATVSVFATSQKSLPPIRAAVEQLTQTLPARVKLEWN